MVNHVGVSNPPLADKRPQGNVRKGAAITNQPVTGVKPLRPTQQNGKTLLLMHLPNGTGIAVGVFEPVEMVLERPIVLRDQRLDRLALLGRQQQTTPIAGISLIQRPAHHRKALINHLSLSGDQDWNGAFRGALQ